MQLKGPNRLLKYWLPIVSLIIGSFLSFFSYQRIISTELQQEQIESQKDAAIHLHELENSLKLHFEMFQTIADFYRAAIYVEREEFGVYVDRLINQNKGFVSIFWLPKIPKSQLHDFEQINKIDLNPDFKITEINSNNIEQQVSERDAYFPIFYSASLSGETRKIGSDMAVASISKELFTKSIQSEKLSYRFYQNKNKLYIFALLPIYPQWSATTSPAQRKSSLMGFLATDINVSRLWQENTPQEFQKLSLVSENNSWQLLPLKQTAINKTIHSKQIEISGQYWQANVYQAESSFHDLDSNYALIFLILGILLTLILSGYLFVMVNQKYMIEVEVITRTKELAARTMELEHHRQFEELIVNISSDFVRIKISHIDDEINRALRLLGEFIRADQCNVFKFNHQKNELHLSHEWYKKNMYATGQEQQVFQRKQFPWIELCMTAKKSVVIDRLNDLPEEATIEKNELLRNGIKSIAIFPLISEGKVYGHVSFAHLDQVHQWTEVEKNLLPLIGELFCNSLVRAENVEKRLQAEQQLIITNRKLEQMARHDSLTGLANRRYMNEVLEKEIQSSARNNIPLSIMLFDIDYFKLYNDHYGHILGDQCLVDVAQVINQSFKREIDLTVRYGGEEFLVILSGTDKKGAITSANKFQSNLEQRAIAHDASKVHNLLTVSIGLVSMKNISPELTLTRLIEMADLALYDAKQKGRNQLSVFEQKVEASGSNET